MFKENAHFLKKFYILFWFTSLILMLIALKYRNIPSPENMFSINVYDTYYAMEVFQFFIFMALFYFLLGFGYWIIKKANGRLNIFLSYFHAIIMFGSLIVYGIAFLLNTKNSDIILVFSLIAVLFIAQPIYVTNLMIGLFNWRKDRKIKF